MRADVGARDGGDGQHPVQAVGQQTGGGGRQDQQVQLAHLVLVAVEVQVQDLLAVQATRQVQVQAKELMVEMD